MPDSSIANQKTAARPDYSIWVSASAGTGKTTVLVARLLRLFLSGVEPHKILCLTYTNAGAVEMQDRIFARAKSWATIGDEALKAELLNLFSDEDRPDAAGLAKLVPPARKLFSKLVDSPVPLKIYTIHAFCQSVLKRFPLEAGISPHFEVADTHAVDLLLKEAYKRLIAKIRGEKTAADAELLASFDTLTGGMGAAEFDSLIRAIVGGREKFAGLIEEYHTVDAVAAALGKKIFADAPVVDDFVRDGNLYMRGVVSKIPADVMAEFLDALAGAKGVAMRANFNALSSFLALPSEDERLAAFENYINVFLAKSGGVRKAFVSAEIRKSRPELAARLDEEAERIRAAVEFVRSSRIYNMSLAVVRIAASLVGIYGELKARDGVMDFSDLIETVERLFRRPNVSEWILYKMDGGISHVLIDEAQDTSPRQWSIIEVLTEQFFTTARGEREMKSVFSVGDRKQSIFSFQGADVGLFEKYKSLFRDRVERGGFIFRELALSRSFRSAKNILALVDSVIANGRKTSGILLPSEEVEHIPHRMDSEGYVELLPLVKSYAAPEDAFFKPPVEVVEVRNPKIDLSDIVAKKIRRILSDDFLSDGMGGARRVEPRDIMILVEKRSSAEYLAGKMAEQNIPLSGEDKLYLSENIAVEDLMSLLKFVVSPGDDLSLCEALKSPLYGLSDDDLFELCHDRGSATVFERILADGRYAAVGRSLRKLVELGRVKTPFVFFNHVLNVDGGRGKFISRLGLQIDDVLDEFVRKTLDYDRARMGKSLLDFLKWFASSPIEVKRDMESANNVVRIQTVHSAKGLEAPIVFLFDTNLNDADLKDRILWSDGLPLYRDSEFQSVNGNFARIYEEEKRAGLEEFYRLLYVAMTRARDRLYVCGWEDARGEHGKSWYSCIKDAMESAGARKVRDEILCAKGAEYIDGEVLLIGVKETASAGVVPESTAAEAPIDIPEFFLRPVANPGNVIRRNAGALSPLDDSRKSAPLASGTLLHMLLDRLAPLRKGGYRNAARDYLEKTQIVGTEKIIAAIEGVFENPAFDFMFDNRALSEVELEVGGADGYKNLRIDRLVFKGDEIWIVDYKSDARSPRDASGIPEKYKLQLAAYRDAVSQIYPDKKIRSAILWLETSELMEVG
ncbi:MAG: double-strand break repair helicase AddA [Rickettsiales bacterium]|jgi:ATP-dependent helicase/nuclease subunit A|nr:double-strand break repair helicase AddA [Rickettsiales bacterium]